MSEYLRHGSLSMHRSSSAEYVPYVDYTSTTRFLFLEEPPAPRDTLAEIMKNTFWVTEVIDLNQPSSPVASVPSGLKHGMGFAGLESHPDDFVGPKSNLDAFFE